MTMHDDTDDACNTNDPNAIERLIRFWREVDCANGNWLHPADRAMLATEPLEGLVRRDAPTTPADALAEHRRVPPRLQASLIPQPLLGDLARADVVLCMPHPELGPGAWLFERDGSLGRERKLAGLRQDDGASVPLWAVDPDLADTASFARWWPRFVTIAERLAEDGWTFEEAIEDLTCRVACVALVPYPGRLGTPVAASLIAALPSAQLALTAVREKAAKGAMVILVGDHTGSGLTDDGDRIRQAAGWVPSTERGGLPTVEQLIRQRLNPDPAVLAPFTDLLASGKFRTGQWEGGVAENGVAQFPWFARSDELQALATALYAGRWVLPRFSWPNWSGGEEARRLRDEPGAIEAAALRPLDKLLTTIVRADRFSDGTLAQSVENGLMLRILKRVEALTGR